MLPLTNAAGKPYAEPVQTFAQPVATFAQPVEKHTKGGMGMAHLLCLPYFTGHQLLLHQQPAGPHSAHCPD